MPLGDCVCVCVCVCVCMHARATILWLAGRSSLLDGQLVEDHLDLLPAVHHGDVFVQWSRWLAPRVASLEVEQQHPHPGLGTVHRVADVVVDEHLGADVLAYLALLAARPGHGPVVAEVHRLEYAVEVHVDPLARVVLDDVLPARHDLELDASAGLHAGQRVERTSHRGDLDEVVRLEETVHARVRLVLVAPPHSLEVVLKVVLHTIALAVLVVHVLVELRDKVPEHLVDVHRDLEVRAAIAGL
mmetsp:Transcript_7238/g.29512  ORF Transcript_7238/g.29512 Transcript_7238/m.29512 type:complete len:244 (+) Transcript_7238:133-864(+)